MTWVDSHQLLVHGGAHEISMPDAAWSTAGFIAISAGFGIVLALIEGPTAFVCSAVDETSTLSATRWCG